MTDPIDNATSDGTGSSRSDSEVPHVKALCFDVFGTVVDWRSSIIAEGRALGRRLGIERDWTALADSWRGLYQPSMERVRTGEVPWKPLDELHMESLSILLDRFDIALSDDQRLEFNRAWHRLQPWPEVVPALDRLATRYTLATLSNANIELAADMADNAGLPWHRILGAEFAGAYKPRPEAYLRSAAGLDLEPGQCMLVAAHNDDLRAASALGFATAFVARPTEYGPDQTTDLGPEGPWDVVVDDFAELDAVL
ncbi:MAG: haloacid dehalogenase type II [Acidimicrobiales bacterium]